MTDLVVRTLDESSAQLFRTMPDPLALGERHRLHPLPPRLAARRRARRPHRARAARWAGPRTPSRG